MRLLVKADIGVSKNEEIIMEDITGDIYDLIRTIRDPERPESLEDLGVKLIKSNNQKIYAFGLRQVFLTFFNGELAISC